MTIETLVHTSNNSIEVTVDELTVVITPQKNIIQIVPGKGRSASATGKDQYSGILTIEISPRMDND